MTRQTRRLVLVSIGLLMFALPTTAAAQNRKLRVLQTAMAGDSVSIIDPVTNQVVGEIPGIEANHGVAAAPDGSRIYVTNESTRTLDVVDTKTLAVTKKIPLSGGPHNVAISKDGRRLYVAMQHDATGVDVIDSTTLTVAKNLPLEGMRAHNVFVTPDGKYVMVTANSGSGTSAAKESLTLRIIDQKTEQHVRSIVGVGTGGHRACAFRANPDGSTMWVLCNQGGLSGFVIYDFATGEVVNRVRFPDLGGDVKMQNVRTARGSPGHGIGVSPDDKFVVASDRWYNMAHVYSLPDLKHLAGIPVALDPFWLSFTPDSKRVYFAGAHSASVSVIDLPLLKEVARIPVGQIPKRNTVAMLP